MRSALLILASFLLYKSAFSQTPFYQDIFRGGVSITTVGNSYTGEEEFLNFIVENPMNYQIKKAFLFISQDGGNFSFNFNFNNSTYYLNESTKIESGFLSFGSGASSFENSSIHCLDISSKIYSTQNSYVLHVPDYNPNSTHSLFSSFTLAVFYQSNSLDLLSTSIFINNKNVDTLVEFEINGTNPINNAFPVSFSTVSTYICDAINDGSYVFVNNNPIGLIGGTDANTNNICSGVYGCFGHYNNTSFGLDDDTSDSLMTGTDALADIKSYVNFGDTNFKVSYLFQPINTVNFDPLTNPVRYMFLAHSTKCDTLHSYLTTADTAICAGEVLNLAVGGDSTYTYAWRYRGNVISTDSLLTIAPQQNRLYSILVSDTNGCSKTEIINIKVNPKPNFRLTTTNALCPNNNGVVVVDSTQGIAPPYRFRKDGGTWQTSPVYANLSQGSYAISIKDTNGCVATKTVTINEVNNTVANFSYSNPLPFVPATIDFTNQSQNASDYQWFVNGVLVTNETNLAHFFESAGDYQLQLVASKTNQQCTDTITKTINLEQEKHLFLSSVWKTDENLVLYSYGYQQLTFTLVNGLGQNILNQQYNLTNGNTILVGQKPLARGVYYYKINATDLDGNKTEVGGKLIRM